MGGAGPGHGSLNKAERSLVLRAVEGGDVMRSGQRWYLISKNVWQEKSLPL